ncbi:MAG: hypothetical protein STSR0009_30770 [Methanoregula sp.]
MTGGSLWVLWRGYRSLTGDAKVGVPPRSAGQAPPSPPNKGGWGLAAKIEQVKNTLSDVKLVPENGRGVPP